MIVEDRMKEWMITCVSIALGLFFIFGLGYCITEDEAKRKKYAEENPIKYAKERCYSKIRGSRPACWTEADWKIYCERVECKRR